MVRAAAFSSPGRRESNQDRAAVLATAIDGGDAIVLAVADGIGGLEGGEEAAAFAMRAVQRLAEASLRRPRRTPGTVGRALVATFEAAARDIWAWSRARPGHGPAGCTLTAAVVWDRRYVVAHAGDTRCYHLGARGACALTDDHTESQRLARANRLSPALALASPLRHRLTNALGWPGRLQVDLVPGDGTAGEMEVGDALLVCSDGVHGALGEADLVQALRETSDPAQAAETLVARALAYGSLDNASVALLHVDPPDAPPDRSKERPREVTRLA